nr:MAG TPA: hypothetical protein [Caudoviricetes sp.]
MTANRNAPQSEDQGAFHPTIGNPTDSPILPPNVGDS